MAMVPRLLTAGALVASLGPAAAVAAAQPSVEPLASCYVAAQPTETQPVTIAGHGFSPYAPIDVFVDGQLQTPAPGTAAPESNAVGDVNGSVPAPYVALGVHPFTLQLVDTKTGESATASSFVTLLSVQQVPARARTGARVRFRGRGFTTPGVAVYAHWLYKGVSHKTVRLAAPTGVCGSFSRKVRQFPFRARPKVGTWTIQFDQQPHYSATAPIFVRLPIKVSRTIRKH